LKNEKSGDNTVSNNQIIKEVSKREKDKKNQGKGKE
jgi:hypothetical protein